MSRLKFRRRVDCACRRGIDVSPESWFEIGQACGRIHSSNFFVAARRKQEGVFRKGARLSTRDLGLLLMLYILPVSVKMVCAPIEMRGLLQN
jgi:hypothetical protein